MSRCKRYQKEEGKKSRNPKTLAQRDIEEKRTRIA